MFSIIHGILLPTIIKMIIQCNTEKFNKTKKIAARHMCNPEYNLKSFLNFLRMMI